MRYGEELKKLLQPLGIYDLGGASGAELEAVGGELDRVYGALVDAEREAMPLTAESEGLAAWEALLPFVPAYQTTDDRRRAIAALLRIDGRSFTVDAINDTLAGCGIRARAEETGKVMTVRITFPYNRGEPDGLAAIKGVGRPVIEQIIRDREEHGTFRDLKDFLERLSGKEVNKRAVENFIKSGAFDSLKGTRKQFMIIYVQIMDQVAQNKKNSLAGQMSLFDIVDDEQKKEFEVTLPDVGEYQKETMLAFEKEVLGVYISGHPLEEYEEKWRKSISATTLDFQLDEETGRTKVRDGSREIIGGMITSKTIKYTKKNQTMAFITVEDLLGTVEVVIFPQSYEKSQQYLQEDSKVFVRGRVSEEDDNASKLICEEVIPFEMMKKELWIQYTDKQSYLLDEQNLFRMLAESEGEDQVVIFCKAERAVKRLPKNANIQVEPGILSRLTNYFGEDCVKVIEKPIEMKG